MNPTGHRKLNQVVDALDLASAAANDPGLIHDLGAGTPEDSVAGLIRTLPVTKVLAHAAGEATLKLEGYQRGDLWLM